MDIILFIAQFCLVFLSALLFLAVMSGLFSKEFWCLPDKYL